MSSELSGSGVESSNGNLHEPIKAQEHSKQGGLVFKPKSNKPQVSGRKQIPKKIGHVPKVKTINKAKPTYGNIGRKLGGMDYKHKGNAKTKANNNKKTFGNMKGNKNKTNPGNAAARPLWNSGQHIRESSEDNKDGYKFYTYAPTGNKESYRQQDVFVLPKRTESREQAAEKERFIQRKLRERRLRARENQRNAADNCAGKTSLAAAPAPYVSPYTNPYKILKKAAAEQEKSKAASDKRAHDVAMKNFMTATISSQNKKNERKQFTKDKTPIWNSVNASRKIEHERRSAGGDWIPHNRVHTIANKPDSMLMYYNNANYADRRKLQTVLKSESKTGRQLQMEDKHMKKQLPTHTENLVSRDELTREQHWALLATPKLEKMQKKYVPAKEPVMPFHF